MYSSAYRGYNAGIKMEGACTFLTMVSYSIMIGTSFCRFFSWFLFPYLDGYELCWGESKPGQTEKHITEVLPENKIDYCKGKLITILLLLHLNTKVLKPNMRK